MVNLELYRAFYVVAKNGSLTKAASELFISQPAVSQAIKQLENQVGGKLFVRTPKGMQLTQEGEMMYVYVAKAIRLFEEAQDRFHEMTSAAVGNIRVGASDTLCKHFLLSHIKSFHAEYPEINIQVTNRTSSESLELLKNGAVDIAFVNLPIETTGDVEVLDVCLHLHDIFVASSEFSDLMNRTVPLKKLEDYPLVMLELTSNTRRAIVGFSHSIGVHLHPEIELGSVDVQIDFAKIGMGIACVPREYVLKELQSGELSEVVTDPPLPARGVALVVPKSGYVNFGVKQFIQQVLGKKS